MTGGGLPRLLTGIRPGRALTLAEHGALHGPPSDVAGRGKALIDDVAAAGLRGRGGAAFPSAVKLRAVTGQRGRSALVVNGAEGEPMGAKDRVLLAAAPHLVIDGGLLAAEAIGARDVVFALKRSSGAAHQALARALSERPDAHGIRIETVPDAYLTGEESALLSVLGGGPLRPTVVPPRPDQRGLGRRPTLISNVETLAHVALIARHGPHWFRELGPRDHPGSALVTLGGAVARPGVVEVEIGAPIRPLLAGAPARAVLVGGYSGSWTSPDGELRRPGAGVVAVLPPDACPPAEVARVLRWMAAENAGQCGPCVHGLEAIATEVASLVAGRARRDSLERLQRWSRQVERRGACHHPDGVARFLRSALSMFAAEFDDHRRHGPCDACGRPPVLLVPGHRARLAA
jgi:NADH:ubiquinone oxidoreductase subunit F (NADH-binding)